MLVLLEFHEIVFLNLLSLEIINIANKNNINKSFKIKNEFIQFFFFFLHLNSVLLLKPLIKFTCNCINFIQLFKIFTINAKFISRKIFLYFSRKIININQFIFY